MLDEIARKLPEIYIDLVTGFIAGLLVLLLDRATRDREPRRREREYRTAAGRTNTISIHENLVAFTLAGVDNVRQRLAREQPDASSVQFFSILAALALGIVYVWFRDSVLNLAVAATAALTVLWLGAAIYSVVEQHAGGMAWWLYLCAMLALLSVGSLGVILAEAQPDFGPQNLATWQPYAHEYGIVALFREVGLTGMAWLASHAVGVAALFIGLKDAALSILFYGAAGTGRLRLERGHAWWIRLAARHAHPGGSLLRLTLSLLLAYLLADGLAVHFLQDVLPNAVNDMLQNVLGGRQSR